MWCSDCQQDVPAVARAATGPLVCPRCDSDLSDAVTAAPLADTGLALQSYDASPEIPSPFDQQVREQTNQRLRSIGRRLRSGYRTEGDLGQSLRIRHDRAHHLWEPAIEQQLRVVSNKASQESTLDTRPTRTSWLVSLMLLAGIATLCGGVGLLVWSSAFQLPATWQWGMTATIAAEGALIVTLVWMATKLWHGSRRTNRQLSGVDRHLTALRHQAENPAIL